MSSSGHNHSISLSPARLDVKMYRRNTYTIGVQIRNADGTIWQWAAGSTAELVVRPNKRRSAPAVLTVIPVVAGPVIQIKLEKSVFASQGWQYAEYELNVTQPGLDPVEALGGTLELVESPISHADSNVTLQATNAIIQLEGGSLTSFVPAGSISAAMLAFDPATQTELDAEATARSTHEARTDNPHGMTLEQIGAEVAGAAAAAITAHNASTNPHAQYASSTTLTNEVNARTAADAGLQTSIDTLAPRVSNAETSILNKQDYAPNLDAFAGLDSSLGFVRQVGPNTFTKEIPSSTGTIKLGAFLMPATATSVVIPSITPSDAITPGSGPITGITTDGTGLNGRTGSLSVDGLGVIRFLPDAPGDGGPVPANTNFFPGRTDANVNSRLTALESGKADVVRPTQDPTYVQAIQNRYGRAKGVFSSATFLLGTGAAIGTKYVSSHLKNDPAFTKFKDLDAVTVSGQTNGAASGQMQTAVFVSASDLAKIGIVPNDAVMPRISTRQAIELASLVNLSSAGIPSTNTNGFALYVGVRYSSAANAATVQNYQPSTDTLYRSGLGFNPGPGTYTPLVAGVPATGLGLEATGYAALTEDGFRIITWSGIPLPATRGGQPIVGAYLWYIAKPSVLTAPLAYTICGNAVVPGSVISPRNPYINSNDYVSPFTFQFDLEPDLSAAVDRFRVGAVTRQITFATSDLFMPWGNSLLQVPYCNRFKGYLSQASSFTDWPMAPFGVSGETAAGLAFRARILPNGGITFSPTQGFRVRKITATALLEFTNSRILALDNPDAYRDSIEGFCTTMEALGIEAIVATEIGSGTANSTGQNVLSSYAYNTGTPYWDLAANAHMVVNRGHEGFWYGDHGGTRIQHVWANELIPFIDAMGSPTESLKLYFDRKGTMVVPEDGLFDTNFERAEKWCPYNEGEFNLTGAWQANYDHLDAGGLPTTAANNSDTLAIMRGVTVTKTPFVLLEAHLNSTGQTTSEIKLELGDPTIEVYVRSLLLGTTETTTRYTGFAYAGGAALTVGDVYSARDTSNNLINSALTFVGEWTGMVDDQTVTLLNFTPALTVSGDDGTLIKVSGAGASPSPIAFTKYTQSRTASFYAQVGKPEGFLVPVPSVNGVYSVSDVKNSMQYDKVTFWLYHPSGVSLNKSPILTYTAVPGKSKRARLLSAKARGAELLTGTDGLAGNATQLATWNITGSVTYKLPEDGGLNGLPKLVTAGVAEIAPGSSIDKIVNITPDFERVQRIQVAIFARCYVPIWNNPTLVGAPITEQTFDWGQYDVILSNVSGANPARQTARAGLPFLKQTLEFDVQPGVSAFRIALRNGSKSLEFARMSIRPSDA